MRKTPRQARSRAMVERLVAAGRDVLVAHGYDGFTTNKVADAAGVSPGSLYQYFPDKAAILDVVLDRWSDEVAERVAAALADRIGATGPAMGHAVADALLAALEADAAVLRVVTEELPAAHLARQRRALEQRVIQLAGAYLAGLGVDDATLRQQRAWVVVLAVEQLAVRWVLDQPAALSRADAVAEIARLAGTYLAAPD
ncbi:TetR/AcrR family transcriptional regulator [Nocardioides sp.]|uniref:TetR/AcrR family transcriptional regulator n=1 Tax=Nocardioides sp. TaxID=35761 RepID=UPI003518680E